MMNGGDWRGASPDNGGSSAAGAASAAGEAGTAGVGSAAGAADTASTVNAADMAIAEEAADAARTAIAATAAGTAYAASVVSAACAANTASAASAASAASTASAASAASTASAANTASAASPRAGKKPGPQGQWRPYELHCHTFHSDGQQSLAELAAAAKSLGLMGVALTDHNTMTGLSGRAEVTEQTGIRIIPGLEWTTFFGHMLTLGIREYVDWRNLSPFHIHRGIEAVHRQGGVVGVAHPYRPGSPMCTGCFWEFEVTDWSQVDYIEVWSGLFPSIRRNNSRAFAFWTELLNRGCRIAATSGRDWHESRKPVTEPVAATFLHIKEDELAAPDEIRDAIRSIREGSLAVSMGPRPELTVALPQSGTVWGIGETVHFRPDGQEQAIVTAGADFSARAGYWELPEQILKLRIFSNLGELAVMELTGDQPYAGKELSLVGVKWLRAELYGVFCGAYTMIGFTNAIFVEEVDACDAGG